MHFPCRIIRISATIIQFCFLEFLQISGRPQGGKYVSNVNQILIMKMMTTLESEILVARMLIRFIISYFCQLHLLLLSNVPEATYIPESMVISRVSVQGVKSLGGHFACLCRGFQFYEVKKNCYYFSKRKWKYFYTFYHFYSEKSSKRAK